MDKAHRAVCSAIAGLRVVTFEYKGLERIVEPHGHGWTSAGVEVVCAYQVDGRSVSGQVPGWKMFHIAKMTDVQATGVFAGPRPDYDPAKLRIRTLCCQLSHATSAVVVGMRG